ncbi:glycoside hydrolase family 61 protein [Daldinia loculata]|uniref:glycoside hydrolase family 61 protein n=1 Tax=Daldinia loculata TaxID=103429 RepID=UPI0020C4A7FF|nr:glycoside hydrolase family 61 protein [Daldinia loculata]KAI1645961.1 glycoside hydrolase family 61 protein [Daldinia loculata]KAI2776761.1 glycoside hydrolase family 61 protein [Daldinia loculata]
MPSLSTALLALAASAPAVLGHGHVRRVIVDGVTYPGYERWSNEDQSQAVTWQFTTEDEGPVPVTSLSDPDIICHLGATNAQASIPVAAGSQLQVVRFNTIGGFEHPGPEMHYLAPCGDAGCANVDKNNLRFFKFFENGLVQGGMADSPQWETQKWATTEVHKNVQPEGEGFVDTFTVTIPANIRPGPYVLRHEILGLHKAHEGQAEFYPQCINLEISGSGDQQPEGVPATEMYHSSDPGVALDIWVDLESYQIPGPAVSNLSFKRDTKARATKRHPRDLKH